MTPWSAPARSPTFHCTPREHAVLKSYGLGSLQFVESLATHLCVLGGVEAVKVASASRSCQTEVGNPGQSFLASASPVVLITRGALTMLSAARRSTHSPVFAMATGVTFLGLHLLGLLAPPL